MFQTYLILSKRSFLYRQRALHCRQRIHIIRLWHRGLLFEVRRPPRGGSTGGSDSSETVLCKVELSWDKLILEHVVRWSMNDKDKADAKASLEKLLAADKEAGPAELVCERCKKNIEELKGVDAIGFAWHYDCFQCTQCSKVLKGDFIHRYSVAVYIAELFSDTNFQFVFSGDDAYCSLDCYQAHKGLNQKATDDNDANGDEKGTVANNDPSDIDVQRNLLKVNIYIFLLFFL